MRMLVQAGVRAGVRACAYTCMYDYYSILLYMRAQYVRMFVGTYVRTCMYVRSFQRLCVLRACQRMCTCLRAHECMHACAYVSARV